MANSIGGIMVKKMIEELEKSQKKEKIITIEEVKALACKHYESGGDIAVECYEDQKIQRNIQDGMTTKESWLELFRFVDAVAEDIRNS